MLWLTDYDMTNGGKLFPKGPQFILGPGECSSPSWELMAGRTSCRAPADDPEVDTVDHTA